MLLRNWSLLIAVLVMLFSSCASIRNKRKFTYFNNLPNDSVYVTSNLQTENDIRVKVNDVLSIKVSTRDDKSNILFNQGVLSSSIKEGGGASVDVLQTDGYRVDNQGNINFPVFGKIRVLGKTLEEVEAQLTDSIATQVKNPIVNVKLMNPQVVVMGEVGGPGIIDLLGRKVTVLEAIGLAGDITETGRKDSVLIIRTNGNYKEYAYLNLNDINVTSSPYFYVQQDDVIVVKPNAAKERKASGGMTTFESSRFALSVVSTAMSIITFVFLIQDRANR